MVLAITHDDAFEAYMAPAFPAECVGSICGAAGVLGGPAAVAMPGPRLRTSAGRLYARLGGTIARNN